MARNIPFKLAKLPPRACGLLFNRFDIMRQQTLKIKRGPFTFSKRETFI